MGRDQLPKVCRDCFESRVQVMLLYFNLFTWQGHGHHLCECVCVCVCVCVCECTCVEILKGMES